MDRPRKVNAKKANKTFGDDEEIQDLNLTFEAKIDRWNGFDPEMYNKEVITEWNKLEIERKKLKAEQLEQKLKDKINKPKTELDEIMSGSDLEDESDQEILDKEVDDDDPNLAKNPRVKSINKNLRDRTETVKYLQNIWDNNVHYDGKSRAMRDTPQEKETDGAAYPSNEKAPFSSDNTRIYSGQFLDLMDQDNFTKEAKEKGDVDLNNVAMPSQAELAFKNFKVNREKLVSEKQKLLYEKSL